MILILISVCVGGSGDVVPHSTEQFVTTAKCPKV